MGTTISNAASHICMSVGIVFILKIYRPACKEAMRFLRGTHERGDAGNSAKHPSDKRGDLRVGLPSHDRGVRGTGFSPLLAHNYSRCTSGFHLRRNRESIYRRAYESSFDTREPDGAVLLIIAFILIFFFGV